MFYVLEFTDDHAQVHHDVSPGIGAHAVAEEYQNEYGGIVYWVEGPFPTESEAFAYLDKVARH